MRIALRLLIALNWTVAGVSAGQVIYGHSHACSMVCYDLAREDLARLHPELKFGTNEYHDREEPLVDDYRHRTKTMIRSGQIGWMIAVGLGTTTAVVLMAIFPKESPIPPN